MFVGFAIGEQMGCVNDPRTRTARTWIYGDESFPAKRRKLYEEIKTSTKRVPNVREWRVVPGQPAAVALMRMQFACVQWNGPDKPVTSYEWLVGRDKVSVESALARRQQAYPRTTFEIVEWIDIEGELRGVTSQPAAEQQTPTIVGGIRG